MFHLLFIGFCDVESLFLFFLMIQPTSSSFFESKTHSSFDSQKDSLQYIMFESMETIKRATARKNSHSLSPFQWENIQGMKGDKKR